MGQVGPTCSIALVISTSPTYNIANFFNDSGLATSNILGRVTGGNLSNIFGTIQTTGFGNANLFLMNPAGFLFGPNADRERRWDGELQFSRLSSDLPTECGSMPSPIQPQMRF